LSISKDAVIPLVDEPKLLPQKALSNIRNPADEGTNNNENSNEGSNVSNEHSFEEHDEWDEES